MYSQKSYNKGQQQKQKWMRALIVSASSTYHNYRHLSSAARARRYGASPNLRGRRKHCAYACRIDTILSEMLAGLYLLHLYSLANNMYPRALQVDYRGDAVTVDAVLGVLTDRPHSSSQSSHPVRCQHRSDYALVRVRLIVYLTDTAGTNFLNLVTNSSSTRLSSRLRFVAVRPQTMQGCCCRGHCQASTLINQLPLLLRARR